MTCLALCAAMRPRSIGGSGSQMMVADLGCRVVRLGVLERDLLGVVLDRLGDLELAVEPDVAGLAVDLGDDLVLLAVLARGPPSARLLHRLEHLARR